MSPSQPLSQPERDGEPPELRLEKGSFSAPIEGHLSRILRGLRVNEKSSEILTFEKVSLSVLHQPDIRLNRFHLWIRIDEGRREIPVEGIHFGVVLREAESSEIVRMQLFDNNGRICFANLERGKEYVLEAPFPQIHSVHFFSLYEIPEETDGSVAEFFGPGVKCEFLQSEDLLLLTRLGDSRSPVNIFLLSCLGELLHSGTALFEPTGGKARFPIPEHIDQEFSVVLIPLEQDFPGPKSNP
ncbi:MAG: hypothetical protein KDD64_07570 [Bdellovibrionales bacterium]|nr:hypothetical protein [Bdellovibrionales bacterium]